jgi:hypothetical protein
MLANNDDKHVNNDSNKTSSSSSSNPSSRRYKKRKQHQLELHGSISNDNINGSNDTTAATSTNTNKKSKKKYHKKRNDSNIVKNEENVVVSSFKSIAYDNDNNNIQLLNQSLSPIDGLDYISKKAKIENDSNDIVSLSLITFFIDVVLFLTDVSYVIVLSLFEVVTVLISCIVNDINAYISKYINKYSNNIMKFYHLLLTFKPNKMTKINGYHH